jgi:hypothetical protein
VNTKKLRKSQLIALFWIVLVILCTSVATYAWFSFNPSTNVEPMSSTVSKGTSILLISNSSTGDFETSCKLAPSSNPDELRPLSTADLSGFYTALAHNNEGISVMYGDVTDSISDYLIHGTVYLKSTNGGCNVYLYKSGLNFGVDIQALASMRLGLKVTTEAGTSTYIFKLDDMGETSGAASTLTVPNADTVVSSIGSDGSAVYTADTSLKLSDYLAVESKENDSNPEAGENIFAVLNNDEVAPVEYWLYLEGCDENCSNVVQNRDISLQLAFAGVTREE